MKNENKLEVALAKEICYICGKEVDGPILMNTKLTEKEANKIKELHQKPIGFTEKPCKECQENLKKAFLIIGIDEEKTDFENLPEGFYRSGHLVGVKKDIPLVQEHIKKEVPEAIKKGYIFMDYRIMEKLGLINNKK